MLAFFHLDIRGASLYSPTDNYGNKTSHLLGIMARILLCAEQQITPVWVFDGSPPSEKSEELSKRRKRKQYAAEESEKAK